MQLNSYWRLQVQGLLLACVGFVLYVVGATEDLRSVGVLICAVSVLLVVYNFIVEIVHRLWGSR